MPQPAPSCCFGPSHNPLGLSVEMPSILIFMQQTWTDNKAAELDGSARIWLCTPQQTSAEALAFLAKNQQLSNVMLMGKQQRPPLEQPISFRSFSHQQTQSKQPMASTTMMTSLEADETRASVAPGKKHFSRVRVYGAKRVYGVNVLTDCLKTPKKVPPPCLLQNPQLRLAE